MKTFQIPEFYRSRIITPIKELRRKNDKLKRDLSPTVLDFGSVKFLIARHFGFCYGVENAIEIAYRAIEENPDKRIFLLSEMIHNPDVNRDLLERGVRFLMETTGRQIIPWEELKSDDIVVVPAFGTTIEIQNRLQLLGIDAYKYDTTCPFVEKVWNRAAQIGQKNYTIVVHGKPLHEETRATFSHSKEDAPTVIVKNQKQAERLARYITGEANKEEFFEEFSGQYSVGFDPEQDLQRIGVVNQTTMLASDTQGIADYLKQVMIKHFDLAPHEVESRFANTRDTLCYATNDNQDATYALLKEQADFVLIAGGYNSSNTSHIVELCETKFPTYFIESANKILDRNLIKHYDLHRKKEKVTENFIPDKDSVTVMLTCGASCPDAIIEGVLTRVLSFFPDARSLDEVMGEVL
ncbi:4-hydroxy-3-methylbut-2-enyl diphosphate reductase [Runella defluvii]|uniref:4-hydroxy-3-methylbut-2-enyl diphosphate reductase n=1 Tax=Runella defluvii TaxID=370973 RepID=A0A7W5ZST6_9BACT|nr:4-hydroxy-3-methylbut-2-enyl diphosphate reductase [Runella defluvii]MBB3840897.1 4-hydroxy-3-methylbut-2-enyl diphosphate reductase [Runella defluvii]HAK76485.1 4-hydroxy-3-methylbut-2-enyl diphosphate reductase [Runella sp.]HAO50372.1 4-hydroxy-3-methylbut-2-enyl diphosphate reductase [Runella sp.]